MRQAVKVKFKNAGGQFCRGGALIVPTAFVADVPTDDNSCTLVLSQCPQKAFGISELMVTYNNRVGRESTATFAIPEESYSWFYNERGRLNQPTELRSFVSSDQVLTTQLFIVPSKRYKLFEKLLKYKGVFLNLPVTSLPAFCTNNLKDCLKYCDTNQIITMTDLSRIFANRHPDYRPEFLPDTLTADRFASLTIAFAPSDPEIFRVNPEALAIRAAREEAALKAVEENRPSASDGKSKDNAAAASAEFEPAFKRRRAGP